MHEVTIRQITPQDFEGFHSCLDAVASERLHLGFVDTGRPRPLPVKALID